jgi:hypothetical protein
MAVPFVEAAQAGDDEPAFRGLILERVGTPGRERGGHLLARRFRPLRQAEQAQHAVAMVGEVGVQANPFALLRGPQG